MMTREMVLELLKTAGDDLSVQDYDDDDEIFVEVEDFDGFDDDYCEIERELDNPELIDSIESQLKESALSVSGDYYRYYQFEGFMIRWGYSSMNI